LLEVLISIGIVAIGLSSVAALLPAGKSAAGKAVILDRASNLAMNVLNDAVTFGLTRPGSVTPQGSFVVFDALGTVWEDSQPGDLRSKGIFSTGAEPAGGSLKDAMLQGSDDIVYGAPQSDDGPPTIPVTQAFPDGDAPTFQGRTTALASVAALGAALEAGSLAKLTVVVFHNRLATNPADAIVSGTYVTDESTITVGDTQLPAQTIFIPPSDLESTGLSLKEIIRPGTVVYAPGDQTDRRWYQVAMAAVDDATGVVHVTFVGSDGPTTEKITIALDSVGLAERIVTLEGPGPYGR